MKTGATRLYFLGLSLGFCLIFSSLAARCQSTYGGITAYSIVNFSGDQVTMDSFNSADPNHSIWQTGMTWHGTPYGVYSDTLSYSSNSLPSRTSDFTVTTDGSIINVGDAQIYGFVDTAPGGSASISANGSVGDLDWVYGGNSGIEPGHADDDVIKTFYSKSLPNPTANGWQTTWVPVPTAPGGATNIGGATYSLLITNRPANSNFVYYSIGLLTQSIFIDASNVVLYLTNGMDLSGSARFTLNTNADVSIYSSGNIGMVSPAIISNLTEYARALTIYDVAGYTNLTFHFAGGFGPAIIYAPSSSVLLSSGGTVDSLVGTIFCNALSVNGHYSFHYDESLGGVSLPVSPWITLQPGDQLVQPGTNVTFSVAVGGSPTAYQWYFSQGLGSNAIDGATNTSLTLTNVQSANWGRYSLAVSNAYGSVASLQAWLVDYADAEATLSGTFNSADGQFQMTVSNVDNLGQMLYIIEASTNLTDWTIISGGFSPFSYTETNAFPQRYYRTVFVQH